MGVDDRVWGQTALKGDAASVALDASIGLRRTAWILKKIADKLDIDISEDLEKLQTAAQDLDETFDRLAGYEP